MASFKINEDHRLKSDSRQWALQKRSTDTKTGDDNWTSIRFYTTLEGAVAASYQYFQNQIEADNITDFMSDSKKLLSEFVEIFSPQLNIESK